MILKGDLLEQGRELNNLRTEMTITESVRSDPDFVGPGALLIMIAPGQC